MKERDTFEGYFRKKLEAHEEKYDPKYWAAYSRKYRKFSLLSILKAWYAPYLYASALFAVLWFGKFFPDINVSGSENMLSGMVDTIFVKEVVYHVDTIYVVDTTYLMLASSVNSNSFSVNRLSNNQQVVSSMYQYKTDVSADAISREVAVPSVKKHSSERISSSNGESFSIDSLPDEPNASSVASQSAKGVVEGRNEFVEDIANLEGKSIDEGVLIVDSIEEQTLEQTSVDSVQTEADAKKVVVFDNDEFSDDFQFDKKIFTTFEAGPQFNMFLPFLADNVKSRYGLALGFDGIFSVNRFQFQTGVHLGAFLFVFDEVNQIPQEKLSEFPGFEAVEGELEEIQVVTRNLFLPLSIGYEFWANYRYSAVFRVGILGNYLLSKSFEYSVNDNNIYRSFANQDNTFAFSHVFGGFTTGYSLTTTWKLQAGIQYFHPMNSIGRSGYRSPGLSFQLGVVKQF